MKSRDNVYVITEARLQQDGEFTTFVYGVWDDVDAARSELKSIADRVNSNKNGSVERRAKTPIGQIDDLSVQVLVGQSFKCEQFYRIIEKPLQKAKNKSL